MNLDVNTECYIQFENLKFRKSDIRYIIFKIQREQIIIENVGRKPQTWYNFIDDLPNGEYRFGIFDFQYKAKDGRQISKLIFISWNPDSSTSFKRKILYATAKQNFKKSLELNSKDFTICSKADLIMEDIIKELEK